MGMTIVEKIIARHTDRSSVEPGEFVNARFDAVMGSDLGMSQAVDEFEKIGAPGVFNPERILIVPDHMAPAATIEAATYHKMIREFAKKHGIPNYFYGYDMGVQHNVATEQGFVLPGDIFIASDSHTGTSGALGAFAPGVGPVNIAVAMALGVTWFRVPESILFLFRGKLRPWVTGKDVILHTIGQIGTDGALYQAMEYRGEVVSAMPMHERFAMCNMSVEAGAKAGIVPPDETTMAYVRPRARWPFTPQHSDPDAHYAATHEWDLSEMEPQVACPSSPANVRPLSEAAGVRVDQVVVGCCANGRLGDLQAVASVLEGRKVHPSMRMIILPGSQATTRESMANGVMRVLVEAGAIIGPSTCGPCYGGHMGLLGKGEVALSTTNRNFVGRMGDPGSQVYLANPYVAAATAVAGQIAGPADL